MPLDLRLGAFPGVVADVDSESAALIVADPLWNDLTAWDDVGSFAARVLKPEGILVGYIGNRHCFDAIERLAFHLTPVRLGFVPVQHENPWDPDAKSVEAGSFIIDPASLQVCTMRLHELASESETIEQGGLAF